MRELLALLSQSKVKIALASSASKKRIHTILDMFNITHYFSVITSTHDVENSKPNPEIFLITAKKLHINPKSCLVIEDSTHGVSAAKNAGMKCIGFANIPYNTQDLSKADIIVHSIGEINWSVINNLK